MSIHLHIQPAKLVVECGILPNTKWRLGCCIPAWLINSLFKNKVLILHHIISGCDRNRGSNFSTICFVCQCPSTDKTRTISSGSHFIPSIFETDILKGSESRRCLSLSSYIQWKSFFFLIEKEISWFLSLGFFICKWEGWQLLKHLPVLKVCFFPYCYPSHSLSSSNTPYPSKFCHYHPLELNLSAIFDPFSLPNFPL